MFNVQDDYFDDGFAPPMPIANWGCHSQIMAVANDVGWVSGNASHTLTVGVASLSYE